MEWSYAGGMNERAAGKPQKQSYRREAAHPSRIFDALVEVSRLHVAQTASSAVNVDSHRGTLEGSIDEWTHSISATLADHG